MTIIRTHNDRPARTRTPSHTATPTHSKQIAKVVAETEEVDEEEAKAGAAAEVEIEDPAV